MLKQTLPMHSLLHSLHVEEEDPLSEEDLEEGLQVEDPGQDDVAENSVDYAKPQGAHRESFQAIMSRTALGGLEKMLRI